MSGHAPGPWKYAANLSDSGFDIGPCLEDGTLDELAILAFTTTGGEEAEANARLMAASPELLEACQEFLTVWRAFLEAWEWRTDADNSSDDFVEALELSVNQKVMEAVKKATEGSP